MPDAGGAVGHQETQLRQIALPRSGLRLTGLARRAACWEKKSSALYTHKNVSTYPELRQFTNRFLNKIKSVGGVVFYVGIHKRYSPESHDANKLYLSVLREAIKRLDQHCANPNGTNVSSLHPERCRAAGRNPPDVG